MFAEYWPTAEGELVADAVNSTTKIVFSSTLDSAPWGRCEPAQVRNGDFLEAKPYASGFVSLRYAVTRS
ncbi:MAG: hypothetical protein M3228_05185 [Actinomycetota bacterium]|nr:hypothetical protein [Actinomycetota bacterium]